MISKHGSEDILFISNITAKLVLQSMRSEVEAVTHHGLGVTCKTLPSAVTERS
jgi:hypothetical protein